MYNLCGNGEVGCVENTDCAHGHYCDTSGGPFTVKILRKLEYFEITCFRGPVDTIVQVINCVELGRDHVDLILLTVRTQHLITVRLTLAPAHQYFQQPSTQIIRTDMFGLMIAVLGDVTHCMNFVEMELLVVFMIQTVVRVFIVTQVEDLTQ